MDPTYSKNMSIKPNDQTSNNLWVNIQMSHDENKEMVARVCKELKPDWKAAYTRIAVLMCKNNIDNINGRVLLQVYPNEAYDTQAVLDSARAYAKEFELAGISQDRYCIKIPSTGPALNACPTLKKEGIATLGTALFGLPQAIACSQAGCLYISPYFNGRSLQYCQTLLLISSQRSAHMMRRSCGQMSMTQPRSTQCPRGQCRYLRPMQSCTKRLARSSRYSSKPGMRSLH